MHLVWDWNGTLLDDLSIVVVATNAALAAAGGGPITADDHRRDFRRPISAYYGEVLGRQLDDDEFGLLDKIFHDSYEAGLPFAALCADAMVALRSWPSTQSLLSMWFHDSLVPAVARYGLSEFFIRVDGARDAIGGGRATKAEPLRAHLAAVGVAPADAILIGDSVDDAHAAASVGAACVLYSGGFTDAALLTATGRPVADTLAGAVLLAHEIDGALRGPLPPLLPNGAVGP